jgi:hypothetical protein
MKRRKRQAVDSMQEAETAETATTRTTKRRQTKSKFIDNWKQHQTPQRKQLLRSDSQQHEQEATEAAKRSFSNSKNKFQPTTNMIC